MKELPDLLAEHLRAPRLAGRPAAPHREGRGENRACGDVLQLYAVESAGRLELRFEGRACGAVLATASYVCQELSGATVERARSFDVAAAVADLGGLPRHRQHAAAVVQRALAQVLAALDD
jgi:NifU-like protein involved in Fe-S cluster formation